jgi:hypothetical protein
VYLEANGSFTVYRYEELKQGLSIIPPWQEDYIEKQSWVKGAYACRSCGFMAYGEERPLFPAPIVAAKSGRMQFLLRFPNLALCNRLYTLYTFVVSAMLNMLTRGFAAL